MAAFSLSQEGFSLVWFTSRSPPSLQHGCWVVSCLLLIWVVWKNLVRLFQPNSPYSCTVLHTLCTILHLKCQCLSLIHICFSCTELSFLCLVKGWDGTRSANRWWFASAVTLIIPFISMLGSVITSFMTQSSRNLGFPEHNLPLGLESSYISKLWEHKAVIPLSVHCLNLSSYTAGQSIFHRAYTHTSFCLFAPVWVILSSHTLLCCCCGESESACAVLLIFTSYFAAWFHREVASLLQHEIMSATGCLLKPSGREAQAAEMTIKQSDKNFSNLWTVTTVTPCAQTTPYMSYRPPCSKHKHLRASLHVRPAHSCVIVPVRFITPALTP